MSTITTLTAPSFQGSKKGYPQLIEPFNGKNGYADEIQEFPSLIYDEPPTWKKVLQIARETIEKLGKKILKYCKLTVKILKSILKVVVLAYSELEEKVSKAIAFIGLISIIKPVVYSYALYENTKDLDKSIKLKDDWGIAFASFEMLAKPCEIVNGLLSFGKSLNKIMGITWITMFSAVTAPLALGLIIYDTIKSLYKMIMISIEFHQMPKTAVNENYTDFRIYLEKKIGVTPQERQKIEDAIQKKYEIVLHTEKKSDDPIVILPSLTVNSSRESGVIESLEKKAKKEFNKRIEVIKDRKISRLKRNTDKKIVEYLLNTKDYLEEFPGKQHTAEKALEDIRKLVTRKLTLNVGESVFCVAEAIMYIVSMIFPTISTVIPVSFSLTKTAFSISKTLYQDLAMKRGLNLPQFYPMGA